MPTLNWIGKDAVVKHHHEVPFHLLKDVPDLGSGDPGAGNLVVRGDNLVALKALLPHYAGQVKCACIDPPYNTGNEGWAYNDNVNSPVIREWLGKVVGKEGETLDRHDRWLCMMYPRLALLRQFITEDGAIFVCLDDNEIGPLRLLMDEIFGASNFVASMIWEKRTTRENRRVFSFSHDYVICYARNLALFEKVRGTLPLTDEVKGRYSNPDNDPRGDWQSVSLNAQAGHGTASQFYRLKTPGGKEFDPPPGRCWSVTEPKFNELDSQGRIFFGKSGNNAPRLKKFLSETTKGLTPHTLWSSKEVGTTDSATKELLSVFAGDPGFNTTPKPTDLFQRIFQIASKPGDLVLDSFAGSGTTGHAVLKLNAANPSEEPRRFIMIELEPEVCRNITRERVRRVAEGYTNAKGEAVAGLGGGFRFCELGEPLFDESGHIRETVKFGELARHVYFTETGEPLPRERVPNTPLLGVCKGLAVYLLFNGILGDKTSNGGNVLTRKVLAALPPFAGPKVIYCAGCLIGAERLAEEGITIRQTPYEIRVS
jgi:site-specific DNA-methyltransferase (adenine-specific)/adenine-specific DNA-methyltransferase